MPADDDTDTFTHLPEPPADETPTIISSNQGRATAPDSQIAKSLTGRKLGHFELIEAVGVGGMAAVIRARDLDLGRDVALKILPPEMAVDPENITRFKQEARAAAKLDHDNIARAYFCGEDQGLHFIAFEFVEGENLRVLMDQRGQLPVTEGIHYMLQVAAGLSHAAARGVVHRDIKPSNIVITPEGRAKIVDMGLARNLDPQTGIDGGVTQSGVTLGTFDYISPEQALEPRTADVRADIYSLGCTFYHVLTGQAPVPEGTAAKKLHHHQFLAPIDPRQLNPNIPDELTAILARMMAKDLKHRYQTPEHLVQHLLALAQKLNLASETVNTEGARNGVYIDAPLPSPPRLSPFVIGMIAIVAIIGMMFVSGTFNRTGADSIDPPPLWAMDKTVPSTPVSDPSQIVNGNPNPTNNDVVPTVQLRQAATTAEFVALLHQGASRIQLTGRIYDLTVPFQPGESLPVALFEGRNLVLDAINRNDPPTIRVAYGPLDDGQSVRPGSLTFRSPSSSIFANIAITGVKFEIVTPAELVDVPMNGPFAAVTVLGVERFRMDECSFMTDIDDVPEGVAVAIGRRAGMSSVQVPNDMTPIEFDRCYFGRVGVGVQLIGRMPPVLTRNCAFATRTAVFRLRADNEPIEPGTMTALHLDRCTALLDGGSVVDLAPRIPVQIDAGHCLFCNLRPEIDESAPLQPIIREDQENRPPSVLIRQKGTITNSVRFDAMRRDGASLPNGYYRIPALEANGQLYTFDECKTKNLSIFDAAAVDLKNVWPLKNDRVTTLKELAKPNVMEAFKANENDAKLRVSNPEVFGRESILGVFNVLGVNYYVLPLQSVVVAPRPGSRQKVWEPDLPTSQEAPTGVYRQLDAALAEAQPNEVVLVRFNNLRTIAPIRLKEGSRVTLRPDVGYRPILAMKTTDLATGMFRPNGGSLTLENIDFYLAEDLKAANNQRLSRSVVFSVGGGEIEFKNCRFNLVESAGADLSLVHLSQPDGEMMLTPTERMPSPRISLTNCFVHGRGNLIDVHPSRSFTLEMDNSLVALDGTFAHFESAAKEPAANAVGTITLTHVTTFLTGSFVHMQAAKREDSKIVGLVPLNVTATQCLFVPAGNQAAAFVRFDRIDTEMQAKELLLWKNGRQNWYGYGSPQLAMFQVQPEEGGEMMMPAKALDSKRWLEFTREAGHACRVRFDGISSDFNFQTVRPNDFRILSVEPMPSRIEGDTISGVVLEKLTK